jgi:hypothetical protein
MEPPASGALEDLRALVLRDHPLHLDQQEILRTLGDGPLDEMDRYPALAQLLEHELLVQVTPREPIRAIDKELAHEAIGGGIAERIKARPIEPRAAKALIEVPPLGRDDEAGRGGGALERFELGGDRPLPLLLRRRDPGVEGRALAHRCSPSLAIWWGPLASGSARSGRGASASAVIRACSSRRSTARASRARPSGVGVARHVIAKVCLRRIRPHLCRGVFHGPRGTVRSRRV